MFRVFRVFRIGRLLPIHGLALAAAFASHADESRGASPRSEAPPHQLAAQRLESASRAALSRGLEYLARRQAQTLNGSFPRGLKGETEEWAPVGVAALGALAYMSAGSSPGRGPHALEVARLIDYLVGLSESFDSAREGYIAKQGDALSRTHGHGFATLALAQAHGMSPPGSHTQLQAALEAAVALIQRSQGSEGGWHYSPGISSLHEGSVTIVYVSALRAAHNAGIRVDHGVIGRAEEYVLRLQDEAGRFRYELDGDRTSVALTAAGIATLNMAGRYDSLVIQNGVDAILKALEDDEIDARWPFYERLYLAQAFWQLSDKSVFERWFEGDRKRIVRSQHTSGAWRSEKYGDCYGTAMNCLALAVRDGLLPIFQR